jgi:hypothetical protein
LPKHLAQLGLEAIPSAATVGGEKALELVAVAPAAGHLIDRKQKSISGFGLPQLS